MRSAPRAEGIGRGATSSVLPRGTVVIVCRIALGGQVAGGAMDYCISDIHGYYDLFCRLLEKIRFGAGDRLFVLGDFVDKGPQSIRLAKLLFSMPDAVCIAGNHEYDFLKFYRALMRETEDYGAVLEQCREYFSDGALLDWETVDRFDLLPFFVQTPRFIGVHAGLPLRGDTLLPPSLASPEQCVYDRRFKDAYVLPRGGKCVLFGHTPVRSLTGEDRILLYPRTDACVGEGAIGRYCKVHLDTGVYLSGVLGCFSVDACRAFYVEGD